MQSTWHTGLTRTVLAIVIPLYALAALAGWVTTHSDETASPSPARSNPPATTTRRPPATGTVPASTLPTTTAGTLPVPSRSSHTSTSGPTRTPTTGTAGEPLAPALSPVAYSTLAERVNCAVSDADQALATAGNPFRLDEFNQMAANAASTDTTLWWAAFGQAAPALTRTATALHAFADGLASHVGRGAPPTLAALVDDARLVAVWLETAARSATLDELVTMIRTPITMPDNEALTAPTVMSLMRSQDARQVRLALGLAPEGGTNDCLYGLV